MRQTILDDLPAMLQMIAAYWRYSGQLFFQLTYVSELISDHLASEFLDAVVSDLFAKQSDRHNSPTMAM